jgi:predicted nucleic acid-binding protein
MNIVRTENRLAPCRSLDAIHIATALLFQNACPEDFTFFTFDERQAAVAKAVGLKLNK